VTSRSSIRQFYLTPAVEMIENRWVCDDFVEHSDLMTLTIREATASRAPGGGQTLAVVANLGPVELTIDVEPDTSLDR
jgi:hypothetical protein